MAQDVKVREDEALGMSKRVTAVITESCAQVKDFVKSVEECGEGVAGLEKFKTLAESILVELTKLEDTAITAESTVKKWFDKTHEADDILARADITG